MLTEMLKQSTSFQDLTIPEQSIYMKLANEFQSRTDYLFMNPEELRDISEIGTKEQWQELLNRQETISYMQGTMAFIGQVSQRKTFKSLVEMAMAGNAQAAKQVQELSGILNKQDSNRVIIMHHIPRPTKQEVTNEEL